MHMLALVREPGSLLEQREEEPLKGREDEGQALAAPPFPPGPARWDGVTPNRKARPDLNICF